MSCGRRRKRRVVDLDKDVVEVLHHHFVRLGRHELRPRVREMDETLGLK